jgi:hypothetical protein
MLEPRGRGGACSRIFLLATTAIAITLSAPAFAELEFQETKWDFDKIGSVEKKWHVFKFLNKGQKITSITSVTPSCGCASAVPGKNVLLPGESGEIKVVYDPSGKSGRHEASVAVTTDDGATQTLSITADIQTLDVANLKITPLAPAIEVSPKSVNLGNLKMGDVVFYKVIIANMGDGELFVTNLPTRDKNGTYLGAKPIAKGKKVEVTFFYKASEKGKINDFVTIESNDPARHEVKVILKGHVK